MDSVDAEGQDQERLLQLPLSRVKAIAKLDPEAKMINQEAAVLITKATVVLPLFASICGSCSRGRHALCAPQIPPRRALLPSILTTGPHDS